MLSRRSLLALSGSLAAGAMLRPLLAASPAAKAPEFSLFTKHLVGLPYDQLAETVAELGFKGVETPVRKGGHVEPARVEEDLPKLVEAFKKCGVKITLMTTDINAVNAADRTEKVLRTARALGMRCAGVSLITNAAAGYTANLLSHAEVLHESKEAAERFQSLITAFVQRL